MSSTHGFLTSISDRRDPLEENLRNLYACMQSHQRHDYFKRDALEDHCLPDVLGIIHDVTWINYAYDERLLDFIKKQEDIQNLFRRAVYLCSPEAIKRLIVDILAPHKHDYPADIQASLAHILLNAGLPQFVTLMAEQGLNVKTKDLAMARDLTAPLDSKEELAVKQLNPRPLNDTHKQLYAGTQENYIEFHQQTVKIIINFIKYHLKTEDDVVMLFHMIATLRRRYAFIQEYHFKQEFKEDDPKGHEFVKKLLESLTFGVERDSVVTTPLNGPYEEYQKRSIGHHENISRGKIISRMDFLWRNSLLNPLEKKELKRLFFRLFFEKTSLSTESKHTTYTNRPISFKNQESAQPQFGQFHWQAANHTEYNRGSAAIYGMLVDGAWISHFKTPMTKSGSLDCEALSQNKITYLKSYPHFVDSPLIKIKPYAIQTIPFLKKYRLASDEIGTLFDKVDDYDPSIYSLLNHLREFYPALLTEKTIKNIMLHPESAYGIHFLLSEARKLGIRVKEKDVILFLNHLDIRIDDVCSDSWKLEGYTSKVEIEILLSQFLNILHTHPKTSVTLLEEKKELKPTSKAFTLEDLSNTIAHLPKETETAVLARLAKMAEEAKKAKEVADARTAEKAAEKAAEQAIIEAKEMRKSQERIFNDLIHFLKLHGLNKKEEMSFDILVSKGVLNYSTQIIDLLQRLANSYPALLTNTAVANLFNHPGGTYGVEFLLYEAQKQKIDVSNSDVELMLTHLETHAEDNCTGWPFAGCTSKKQAETLLQEFLTLLRGQEKSFSASKDSKLPR